MATTPWNYGFGGDGAGVTVPKRFQFADTQARDTYFSSHLQDLIKLRTYIYAGNKLQLWTGGTKPKNYTPTRWSTTSDIIKGDKGDKGDDGAGINTSALKQGEIPSWDVATKTLIPSGVHATDGEITVSPDSVIFGDYKMSSSVDNVIFENTNTGKHYAPIWQAYDGLSDDAHIRVHSAPEVVVRVPDGNIDVTNPVNSGLVVDYDETFIGGTFILTNPARDVELQVFDHNGKEAWRDKFGDLDAGSHTVVFDTPIDIKAGFKYTIKLLSEKGDVVAKSNTSTGFSWTVNRAKWTDKIVAKKEDLDDAITDVTISGNLMTLTHYDGAKHALTLPTSGGSTTDPKTITDVKKVASNFVFTHADGSTTTLTDNTGVNVATFNALKAEVETTKNDITALKSKDTSLESRVTQLEGKPNIPPKAVPMFYGIFDTTWPTDISGATPSSGKRVTISRSAQSPQRAFIIVPIEHASSVTGITEGSGIATLWASGDRTYDSKKYKVFYSPRELNEQSATFTVTFNQGGLYV